MSRPVTRTHAPENTSPAPPEGTAAAQRPPRRPSSFRALGQLTGPAYLPISFTARLPLAFLSIGVLTLLAWSTGSYAAAGLAAAVTGIGQAIGGPLSGYLADRTTQRAVLLPGATAHAILLAVLLWQGLAAETVGLGLLVIVFLTGLTCPQVGSMSRVRWQRLTAGRQSGARELTAALSLESMADELTFVLGPALVGFLASLVSPWLPLAVAAALTAVMVPWFALHRTGALAQKVHGAAASATAHLSPARWTPRAIAGVSAAVVGMIGMGGLFGTISASSVAFAGEGGNSSAGGLFYAAMGVASAATALSVSAWPSAWGQSARWIACSVLLLPAVALLLAVDSVPAMVGVVFLIGLPIGPVLVTIYTIGSQTAPAGRMGTIMTMLASGVVVGVSLGNAVAGAAADAGGSHAAFATVVAAAFVLLAAASASALVRRRARAR